MKAKTKRILITILALLTVFFGMMSCADTNDDDGDKVSLTMQATLSLEQYDTSVITLKVKGLKTYQVEWTTSNSAVVKIISSDDKSVTIQTLEVGNATISATLKDTEHTATCNVQVYKTGEVAVVKYPGVSNKTINLFVNGSFNLAPELWFANEIVSANFTYTVEGDAVSVENGVITALKKGVSSISVKTQFFGKEVNDAIVVNVYDNSAMIFGSNKIDLYKPGNSAGNVVTDTIIIQSILDNGVQVDLTTAQITYESLNPSIATVNSDGVVSAVGCGTTEILVTYVNSQSVEITNKITVVVHKDLVDYSNETNYDVNLKGAKLPDVIDAILPLDQIVAVKDVTDTAFEIGYTSKTINVEDAKIGKRVWQLETDETAYKIGVTVCSNIIYTAEDFYNFFTKEINYKNYLYEGYVVLANDINMSEYYVYEQLIGERYDVDGFNGVFDGRNHTVENLMVKDYGLFNVIGMGGLVKNVNFKNATSYYANGFLARNLFGMVENISLDLTLNVYEGSSIASIASQGFGSVVTNCVVNVSHMQGKNDSPKVGSFILHCDSAVFTNCYVITDLLYAVNPNKYQDLPSGLTVYKPSNVGSFSGLDTEIWALDGEYPTLKSEDDGYINADDFYLYDFDKSSTETEFEIDLQSILSEKLNDSINVHSVCINDVKMGTVSNGKWIVEKSEFSSFGSADYIIKIFEKGLDGKVIKAKISVVDKILDTATEFYNYFDQNLKSITEDVTGYIILGENIDMSKGDNDVDYTELLGSGYPKYQLGNAELDWLGSFGFAGTFDGRGYSVTGLRLGGFGTNNVSIPMRGLFGRVTSTGVVKNLSLLDAQTFNSSGVISTWYGGLLENVYIEALVKSVYVGDTIATVCLETHVGESYMIAKDVVVVCKYDKTMGNQDYNQDSPLYTFARDYDEKVVLEKVTVISNWDKVFDGKTTTDLSSQITFYTLDESYLGTAQIEKSNKQTVNIDVDGLIPTDYPFDFNLVSILYKGQVIGEVSNGVWTIDKSELDGFVAGDYIFTACLENSNVKYVDLKVNVKEMIILSTATEFYTYFNERFNNATADIDDDIVLGADIDMSKGDGGVDYSEYMSGYLWPRYAFGSSTIGDFGFTGTFDGKGYTVKGLRIGNPAVQDRVYGGLFGRVKADAVIKNVSFVDVESANSPVFATWFAGTLENVYVEATIRGLYTDTQIGLICLQPFAGTYMTVKDSVFVCKYDKTLGNNAYDTVPLYALARDYDENLGFENVVVITDLNNLFENVSKQDLSSKVSSYSLSDFSLKPVTFNKSVSTPYSVNVADIMSSAIATDFVVTEISYNGAKVGNIANAVWTIDNSVIANMTSGDYELKAIFTSALLSDVKFEMVIEVAIVDQVLTTATEVYNYFKQFETLTADIGGYTVLGADIDMSKGDGGIDYSAMPDPNAGPLYPVGNVTGSMDVGFTGIFDGNGHSITGLRIANKRGLYCHVKNTAIIRNVAFVDTYNFGSSSVFGTWFAGTLENVYVEATIRNISGSDTAVICVQNNDNVNYMTMKNCVIKTTLPYPWCNEYAVAKLFDGANYENVYAITDMPSIFSGKTKDAVKDVITCYSVSEVESGTASFDKLDQNIWDLTGNYPTLK